MEEGSVALLPELLVLLALHAPHPLHHLFTQLHGRRQRFGISTENVAEVDVEEFPCTQAERENYKKKKKDLFEQEVTFPDVFPASPVFVSSRLSRCRSPTPRM